MKWLKKLLCFFGQHMYQLHQQCDYESGESVYTCWLVCKWCGKQIGGLPVKDIKMGKGFPEFPAIIYPENSLYQRIYVSKDDNPERWEKDALERADSYGLKLQIVLALRDGEHFCVFESHEARK